MTRAVSQRMEECSMVSFRDYLSIDAVSASTLKDIRISPRHYWRKRKQPYRDSDTLRLGRAGHTAILEPDRFLRDYVLWDQGRRAGKQWEAFRAAAGKRTILTELQYDQAIAMRDAVRDHPVAGPLVERITEHEVTLLWDHPRTGVPCKGRLDAVGDGLLVDVKTTNDPSPHKFQALAYRLGYHLQLAWYSDGMIAAGRELREVKILAVQNKEPFDVVVYTFGAREHSRGVEEYEAALDTLLACREAECWPGIAEDGEVAFELPTWAAPEQDAELTFNGQSLSWGEE